MALHFRWGGAGGDIDMNYFSMLPDETIGLLLRFFRRCQVDYRCSESALISAFDISKTMLFMKPRFSRS